NRITALVDRMVVAIVQSRPEVIHRSAKRTAGEFKCSGQAGSARGTDRRTIRLVAAQARDQRVRIEIRETSRRTSKERLVLLGLHGTEVILRCRIDGARLRVIHSEVQAKTIPDPEWIASKQVEARALLLEVQSVLEAQARRQFT